MAEAQRDTQGVKTYGQYCPIARASEILAQRWTPVLVRNLLNGPATYSKLADQTPGIPRSLLTSRLRMLQTAGLVEQTEGSGRSGRLYQLTDAGMDLATVVNAMGTWGERWLGVTTDHADPVYFLNSWVNTYLDYDTLPTNRVVARFEFTDQPAKVNPMWVVFDREQPEVCRENPGYEEDLTIKAESVALTEWHLGRTEWAAAVKEGRITVDGLPKHAKALPTWNRRSRWVSADHAESSGDF